MTDIYACISWTYKHQEGNLNLMVWIVPLHGKECLEYPFEDHHLHQVLHRCQPPQICHHLCLIPTPRSLPSLSLELDLYLPFVIWQLCF